VALGAPNAAVGPPLAPALPLGVPDAGAALLGARHEHLGIGAVLAGMRINLRMRVRA
jgi:hypothetical protein